MPQQLADLGATRRWSRQVRTCATCAAYSGRPSTTTPRDLDQIEVAERLPDGMTKVMVAIADVDAFVPKDSPIDQSAARQTTTVYTGIRNFPMLPEQLSPATTSLQETADKLAVVIEFVVGAAGPVEASTVYRAVARNTAQLTYNAVGAWLESRALGTAEGGGVAGPPVAASTP